MSDPIVDPSDLATFLGQTFDEGRVEFVLEQAQALCESIVSPLPDGASAVVIDVACRALANPMSTTDQHVGPFGGSFGAKAIGGLYLTKANERTLRRLAGSGGAFSINLLSGYCPPGLPVWDDSSGEPVVATS